MGLKIIKSVQEYQKSIKIKPIVSRFFYETTELIPELTTIKIEVNEFLDDSGEEAESLPNLSMGNSYFNVYINGILQMDDNFAYTAGESGIGSLLVSVPEESEIPEHTSIILEVINFEPSRD